MNMNAVYRLSGLMDYLITKNKETGQEFYPVLVRVFLYIAEHNKRGVTLNQIERDLGLVQTSVYRAVAALSEGTSKKPEGLDYVESKRNPADYRSKIVTLTKAGHTFLNELTAKGDIGRGNGETMGGDISLMQ